MIDFEAQLEANNERSKKFAWRVVFLLILVLIIQSTAIILMLPLKTTDLKMVVVDKNTGFVNEVTSLAKYDPSSIKSLTSQDALNKFFVQQYITNHDTYNYYTIRNQFEFVKLYSSDKVFNNYSKKFKQPYEIVKKLGKENIITNKINSISISPTPTPFKKDTDGITITARVERFFKREGKVRDSRTGTITLTMGYDLGLKMDARARTLNPLGVVVTSYKFERDQE